jgi:histone-arginine methyltransferase CARM1
MDLGAGSGILSYFAVQAGAKTVYAVEASSMASKIKKIADSTALFKDKIVVVEDKIENDSSVLTKVDTIVSEPIGVLLVHERMLESYLVARDKYLKPGGMMVPASGNIYLAPFSDPSLWTLTNGKVRYLYSILL